MALKKYKPRSCGMRFRESATFEEITEKRPVKRLTKAVRKTAGRNNQGRITTRHHGGGAKQRMRIVDFKRNKFDVEATVKDIAYDPTRSAYLALIEYTDGVKNYILAPEGLKPGMKVMNGAKAEATVGNCLPLSQIPLGLFVHAVELVPGRGAAVARSAGNSCQVMARDGSRVTLKMPSGEVRIFNGRCLATVGSVGNKDWGSKARQGWPQALPRHSSDGSRCRHEPCRPPDGRRRRPYVRRLQPAFSVGQARQGRQDPSEAQGFQQDHRQEEEVIHVAFS